MTRPTIGHITDLHLADTGQDVTLSEGHALADAILDDPPDVLINTGDDVGSGWASQFHTAGEVTRRFRDADIDYLKNRGNHDVALGGISTRRWTLDNWEAYADDVADHYDQGDQWPVVVDYGDVRIIMMDTCAEATAVARGVVGDEQIARIEQAVEGWGGVTVLAGHHCPSASGPGLEASLALTDRRELASALSRAGGVDLWLTGHLHQQQVWSRTYGARYILSIPMSAAEGAYRRIWWEAESVHWELVSV